MRPLEGDKLPFHPDFYPLYEEAQRLDLAIVVHLANANPAMCDMLSANPAERTNMKTREVCARNTAAWPAALPPPTTMTGSLRHSAASIGVAL